MPNMTPEELREQLDDLMYLYGQAETKEVQDDALNRAIQLIADLCGEVIGLDEQYKSKFARAMLMGRETPVSIANDVRAEQRARVTKLTGK